ncbi:MAG TPA: hypothetical protein VFF65_02480, partial [Phycisphaerales bacterium]|nr:hypothetical protein [Phycisphaerales bacterium]
MSSIPHDHAGHAPHDHGHDEPYLAPKATWFATFKDWATTIDHKKIGVMYLTAILFMFFLGGMAALAVRVELLTPTKTLIDAAGNTLIQGQLFGTAGATSVNDGN